MQYQHRSAWHGHRDVTSGRDWIVNAYMVLTSNEAIPPNKKDDFAAVLVPPFGDRDILPVLTSLLFAYPSLAQRIASSSIDGRPLLDRACWQCRDTVEKHLLVLGRYMLDRQVHQSSTSVVWRAFGRNTEGCEPVAIKVMRDKHQLDAEIQARNIVGYERHLVEILPDGIYDMRIFPKHRDHFFLMLAASGVRYFAMDARHTIAAQEFSVLKLGSAGVSPRFKENQARSLSMMAQN